MRQKRPAPVVIDSATYASAHDQFTRYHSHYTSTLYSTCTAHNLLCQWQPDRSVVWLAHLSLQRPLQGSSQASTLETPHPDHATHGLSCRQQAGETNILHNTHANYSYLWPCSEQLPSPQDWTPGHCIPGPFKTNAYTIHKWRRFIYNRSDTR